jgi:hypothetical protein
MLKTMEIKSTAPLKINEKIINYFQNLILIVNISQFIEFL